MKTIYKLYSAFLLLGILVVSMAGCEKTLNTDVNLPRPFTPASLNINAGETQAVISWPASLFSAGKGVTYTVQVSKDPNFAGTPDQVINTDTTSITLTDAVLTVKQTYYVRVKAVSATGTESKSWVVNTSGFMITGEQIFSAVLDAELKDKSVTLRWRPTDGLTKIVLTPAGGPSVDIPLDATDISNNFKLITDLEPSTAYTAEIFKEAVTKGTITFTTKAPSIFTTTITTADNLVSVVAAAANGDVIGLEDGTYDCVDGTGTFTNLTVTGKKITLQSVSGDPAKVKVNYKEITLKGAAGIILKNIEFDGAPSTAAGQQALYFINLVGAGAEGEATTFSDIIVDNCLVHDMGNTFMRGNRGSGNGDFKIDTIKINNSLVYNSAKINNNYSFFQINKLQFTTIQVTNSTLYSIGRAFVDWDANFSVTPRPTIMIDQCTINNLGMANMQYILFDVNNNDIEVTMQNSIVMNSPYPSETVQSLIRGANALIKITHSNYAKLTDGAATPAALTIPASVTLSNNSTIDLGWTAATTDFTLPAASPLRTAGTTGGPIGDPRWAF